MSPQIFMRKLQWKQGNGKWWNLHQRKNDWNNIHFPLKSENVLQMYLLLMLKTLKISKKDVPIKHYQHLTNHNLTHSVQSH